MISKTVDICKAQNVGLLWGDQGDLSMLGEL